MDLAIFLLSSLAWGGDTVQCANAGTYNCGSNCGSYAQALANVHHTSCSVVSGGGASGSSGPSITDPCSPVDAAEAYARKAPRLWREDNFGDLDELERLGTLQERAIEADSTDVNATQLARMQKLGARLVKSTEAAIEKLESTGGGARLANEFSKPACAFNKLQDMDGRIGAAIDALKQERAAVERWMGFSREQQARLDVLAATAPTGTDPMETLRLRADWLASAPEERREAAMAAWSNAVADARPAQLRRALGELPETAEIQIPIALALSTTDDRRDYHQAARLIERNRTQVGEAEADRLRRLLPPLMAIWLSTDATVGLAPEGWDTLHGGSFALNVQLAPVAWFYGSYHEERWRAQDAKMGFGELRFGGALDVTGGKIHTPLDPFLGPTLGGGLGGGRERLGDHKQSVGGWSGTYGLTGGLFLRPGARGLLVLQAGVQRTHYWAYFDEAQTDPLASRSGVHAWRASFGVGTGVVTPLNAL